MALIGRYVLEKNGLNLTIFRDGHNVDMQKMLGVIVKSSFVMFDLRLTVEVV